MVVMRTGSKRLLRDLNQSIVLNLIVEQGLISRTDLARRSGLPAATITRIAHDFVEAGLALEITSEASSGGRRPVLLSINPSAGYVVGFKLRADNLIIAICDLNCAVVYTHERPLDPNISPEYVIEAIVIALQGSLQAASILPERVLGVGIGLAGIIDSSRGICHYSSLLGWQDVELGPTLAAKIDLPVLIDNDVNALALGERYFGICRDINNFLLVTIGQGVGLGIVVNGEIYRGSHGGAGELGHTTVDSSATALPCNCGKHGCLEAIASDEAIVNTGMAEQREKYCLEDAMHILIMRAHEGDTIAQAAFSRAGQALGVAIANLVNVFDPDLILLSGEGLRAGDLLLEPLKATAPLHIFGSAPSPIKIRQLSVENVHWARGAASLVLRKMLQPPIYEDGDALIIHRLLSAHTT